MEVKNANHDLTQGVIWKKLLSFFFPILLGMLFQQLYSTVDAAIVGKYIGSKALAAVGSGSTVISEAIIGLFMGLNSGFTVMISQRFGANDETGLQRVLHTAVSFVLIVGSAVTIIGYFCAPAILNALNTPADILPDSILYLRIYFTGSIPLLLCNLFNGTLQAAGNSRLTLIYLIISCLLNIALDLLFVVGFGWGVSGAGIATVISMIVCAVLALSHLLRSRNAVRLDIHSLCFDLSVLKITLPIGLPAGIEGTLYSISNMIIQTAVNGFGTTIVAAWAATSKLDGFYWITVQAFGITICAIVGQCCGAGKLQRMRQSIQTCMKIAIGTTVILSALLLFSARRAYGLLLNDAAVIDQATTLMQYFVPFYAVWTVVEILSGTFRGAGDTLRPMIITLIGSCLFRILWMYIVLPAHHSMFVVSIVYAISWLLTAASMTVYYFRGSWLRIRTPPEE